MGWLDRHTHLEFKYRRRTRTVTSAVAESYLRDDVSCGSDLCTSGCTATTSRLSDSALYYLIPDADVLDDYLEVFEQPALADYILLSSVVKNVLMRSNIRKIARVRALYKDTRRRCYLFSDLACRFTAHAKDVTGDPLLAAAEYYCHHLDGAVPLLVVSNRLAAAAAADSICAKRLASWLQQFHPRRGDNARSGSEDWQLQGIVVLSAAEFFSAAWPHSPAVLELFDSLQQARLAAEAEAAAKGTGVVGGKGGAQADGGMYKPHMLQQAIEDGLAAGELLQGVLHVSKRDPQEAVVQVGSGADTSLGRLLRVVGSAAMNRALEGDVVAVRLLEASAPQHWSSATGLAPAPSGPSHLMTAAAVPAPPVVEAPVSDALENGVDYGAEVLDADTADQEGSAVGVLGTSAEELLAHAEVVGILQRNTQDLVASVSAQDQEALTAAMAAGSAAGRQEAIVCVPYDRRLPRVRVRTKHASRLVGQRFVLRVDGWDRQSRYPSGHVVRVLGAVNDLRVESEALLAQCGISWQPFCDAAMAELPQVASADEWAIPAPERATRRDLTGLAYFVCSIDPPDCVDVDDALHMRHLPDGGLEVGVHIADVSYFVRQGGVLDGEARSRCTTVYLVERRLDMLPALLSEQLCSLRSGSERLAVSVIWHLDPPSSAGCAPPRIRSTWFGRSLIRSRHQLSYQQAQDVLDGRVPRAGDELPDADAALLRDGLAHLKNITDRLHAARLAAGALELASAELRFVVGPDGQPVEVEAKAKVPMMDVVAEMMIWANAAVAERIAGAFPGCALLRNHPAPRSEAFEQVRHLLEAQDGGHRAAIDPSSNQALAAALAAACARQKDPAAALLVRALTTRAMSEAKYFSTGAAAPGSAGAYHYGLALPYYTHFTSPIRRYADIVVHRQLLAAIANPAAPHAPMQHAELAAAAAVMNTRHRESKRAQKECSEVYLLLLLHSRPHAESAIVCGFQGAFLEVFVPQYQLRGRVQMVDRRGRVVLPLEADCDTGASTAAGGVAGCHDPFQDAEQCGFSYHADDTSAAILQKDGTRVWQAEHSQRVWVRLAADGSHAHGPKLLIRLLSDTHPEALAGNLATATTLNNTSQRPASDTVGSAIRADTAAAAQVRIKMTAVLPPLQVRQAEAKAAREVESPSNDIKLTAGNVTAPEALSLSLLPDPLHVDSLASGMATGRVMVAEHIRAVKLRRLQAKVAHYTACISASSSYSSRRAKWLAKLQDAQARLQAIASGSSNATCRLYSVS